MYKLYDRQKDIFGKFEESLEKNIEIVMKQIVEFMRTQQRNAKRPKAVVGFSGGIDSSLTATVLVRALGRENVIGVKMPYQGVSSNASIKYANRIIDFLQLPATNVFEIPITEAVDATLVGLASAGIVALPLDVGNVMARERMKNLYPIARVYNGMVVDTCNKTEVLLGYFTRYGDGASDYNPMGGIYKTQVWQLARYLKLPSEIIVRKPSAELSLGQNDEDDLGISYAAVDLMLWLANENNVKQRELTEKYFYPSEVVEMILQRIEGNRFKNELPPLLGIKL
ncbi:MAG: NAD+ synthase [Candidatus Pacebacteria bacterium]|nr:NAD+ synthase [Candidatus Paceibacterota bacterium]